MTFENSEGERLAALLDRPVDGDPIAYALFAHCFTCSKDLKAANDVSRSLAAEGVAVLRFDFTGIGESEGEFARTTFSSNVTDLVAAAEFMARDLEAPKILVGHSLGGAAVLKAAGQIPSARAVATIAAPSSPRHVLRAVGSKREDIVRDGEAEVVIAGRPIRIRRRFLDDLAEDDMRASIGALGRALLVFHSPLDEVVGIDNATDIFVAARHPKSFVSLDSADHLLTNREDSRYVGSVIAAWARKYLGVPQEERKIARTGDNRIVARTDAGGFRTEILANGHSLIADEPISVGGNNTGPSPYDLLAAALGACTTMTLSMYADRKGWPLHASEVHLTHEKIHCEDCAESENPRSKIDHFTRNLILEGPLDDEQRRRLLEIADRCPVHRTLHSKINVKTILAD
jgi:putative redox protein